MTTINRLMINICSDKLTESRDFYTKLFDFNVDYDSDWFVHLISKDKQLELGIIDRTHQIVPTSKQNTPDGFFITLVVDEVDAVYQLAKKENLPLVSPPTDMPYGQRRMLIEDPNGTMIDVSSPIPNFEF